MHSKLSAKVGMQLNKDLHSQGPSTAKPQKNRSRMSVFFCWRWYARKSGLSYWAKTRLAEVSRYNAGSKTARGKYLG